MVLPLTDRINLPRVPNYSAGWVSLVLFWASHILPSLV